MGDFWRVNLDQQMFTIAEQRPYVWKYLFLNDYMRTGNKVVEYLEVMRQPGHEALKSLTGRFVRAEDAETIANNLFNKYTGFQVAELRRIVRDLFNILAHLKSMLDQADQDSDQICKPEIIIAMCSAFIQAFNPLKAPEMPKDSNEAIRAVIAFLSEDQNFGEIPGRNEVQQLQTNLFQLSRGDSLESKNPCQMMQDLYRAALKILLPHYSDNDFIVQGLPEYMCCAQQCCGIPFQRANIIQQRVDKTFKQIAGFNILGPDVNMADIPRSYALLEKARRDFFLLLRCSGYFNRDKTGSKILMPMTNKGWQHAFFDQQEFFMVPAFNHVRLRAILEAVQRLNDGEALPVVVGKPRGRIGNLYVLKSDVAPAPMDIVKPEKSVHWADIGRPLSEQSPIKPYEKPVDKSRGVIIMVIAAALVAVTVLS